MEESFFGIDVSKANLNLFIVPSNYSTPTKDLSLPAKHLPVNF
jgi:hypothetical protein